METTDTLKNNIQKAKDGVNAHYGLTFKRGFSLWKQGAEARLFIGNHLGNKVIVKQRFIKKYRHPLLDDHIGKERLRAEARGLLRCKASGVKSPIVYFVDINKRAIYLEYVEGSTIKQLLETLLKKEEISTLADIIGKSIALIHSNNLIHGDLTTSNMIYVNEELTLIDFGLSNVSSSAEDKAVDLYVLERAITTTHASAEEFFCHILDSYRNNYKNGGKEVLKKYEEVKARGRKRTMVG